MFTGAVQVTILRGILSILHLAEKKKTFSSPKGPNFVILKNIPSLHELN